MEKLYVYPDQDDFETTMLVYTLTKEQGIPGWNTDLGRHGYGLKKSEAEAIAKCVNDYDRLYNALKEISEHEEYGETCGRDLGPSYCAKIACKALGMIK